MARENDRRSFKQWKRGMNPKILKKVYSDYQEEDVDFFDDELQQDDHLGEDEEELRLEQIEQKIRTKIKRNNSSSQE